MDTINKTLEYYNENAENFVETTIDAEMTHMYQLFQKYVSIGGKILDLGCGSGRDSKYFLQNGYDVVAVDGSLKICEMAAQYIGKEVRCLRFEDISFDNEFDGVWACATLLHIPKVELHDILEKLSSALKPNGYLYASFKYGNTERTQGSRFFSDFNEESIKEVFNGRNQFEILEMIITEDVRKEKAGERWINIVAINAK